MNDIVPNSALLLASSIAATAGTMVNQQWPWDPSLRGGAWEYHSAWTGAATPNLTVKAGVLTPSEVLGAPLISSAPIKPIRYWFEMGDQDLFYLIPTIPDGMHDWTLSAELMAKVLAEKGLPLSVRVCEERQARRPADRGADAAVRPRMGVEGLSDSVTVLMPSVGLDNTR